MVHSVLPPPNIKHSRNVLSYALVTANLLIIDDVPNAIAGQNDEGVLGVTSWLR